MQRATKNNELLSGSIWKHVIRLAVPMIVAFIFVTSYHYIDRFFVSKLGDVATAAIGMAFIIQMVVIAIGVGIGSGVNSFISRNLGAGNEDIAKDTVIHAMLISVSVGFAFAVIGILTQEPLYQMMGAEGELLNLITSYLTIIFLFTPVSLLSVIGNSIFQGWGDTMTPMKFMLTGTFINLALDPLLIFGISIFPEMGIEGAALATGIGRTISVLYIFYKLLIKYQPAKISFAKFRLNMETIAGIFQVGLPSSVSQILTSIAMGYVFYILDPFGEGAKAAYTIVFTYEMVVFLPAIGISQAVTILTGHNFGALLLERVNKIFLAGTGVALSMMTTSALLLWFLPELFAGVFAQSPEVLKVGATALQITSVGYAFSAIYLCAAASFQGLGLGRHYLAANIFRLYFLLIPFTYLGAMYYQVDGVWLGLTAVNIISALVVLVWHQYIYRYRILTGEIKPLLTEG